MEGVAAMIDPRQKWLAMLAKLTAPMDPEGAASAFAAMAPMLADMPTEAFTMGSLDYVASQCRRVPSYGELRSSLTAWWSENKPRQLAITTESRDTDAEKWDRRSAELRAEWDDPAGIRARVATCQGEERYLLLLRAIVEKWAPQHAWIVPPQPGHVAKQTA